MAKQERPVYDVLFVGKHPGWIVKVPYADQQGQQQYQEQPSSGPERRRHAAYHAFLTCNARDRNSMERFANSSKGPITRRVKTMSRLARPSANHARRDVFKNTQVWIAVVSACCYCNS